MALNLTDYKVGTYIKVIVDGDGIAAAAAGNKYSCLNKNLKIVRICPDSTYCIRTEPLYATHSASNGELYWALREVIPATKTITIKDKLKQIKELWETLNESIYEDDSKT